MQRKNILKSREEESSLKSGRDDAETALEDKEVTFSSHHLRFSDEKNNEISRSKFSAVKVFLLSSERFIVVVADVLHFNFFFSSI